MPSIMFFIPDFSVLEMLNQILRREGVDPLQGFLEARKRTVEGHILSNLPDLVVVTPTQNRTQTSLQELWEICTGQKIKLVFLATDTDVNAIPKDMLPLAEIVFLEREPSVVARQLLDILSR